MYRLSRVSSSAWSSPLPLHRLDRCLKSQFRSLLRSLSNSALSDTHQPPGTTKEHGSTLRASVVHKAHSAPFPERTHHCGSLSAKDAGCKVVLTGWLLPGRKVGKAFYFFPLRDPYGTIQLVVPPSIDGQTLKLMQGIPTESTVLIEGVVIERPTNQKRAQPGGDIEVSVTSLTLLNPADANLPFAPADSRNLPHEDLRLRYRYLDLRRPVLSNNLHKRSKVAHIVRSTLHDNDFVEVETPILLKSTPEGAREFLVPTRLSSTANARSSSHPLFYALPQSPQQPKQLLIASGAVDRYYQIARCFRDEDGRKDRQPEFTQIDLEMAWVSWGNQYAADAGVWRIGGKEVKEVIETLIRRIWSTIEGVELPEEFRVMTYAEAMNRFGSDKPDVRFGLELSDITQCLPEPLQARLSQTDDIVEALVVRSTDELFRRAGADIQAFEGESDRLDVLQDAPRQQYSLSGSAGLLSDYDVQRAVANAIELQKGDTIWVAKRSRIPQGGSTTLGRLRLSLSAIAQSLGTLSLPTDPHFLWVTEFPLFTRADSDKDFLTRGRWGSSHHPFTAPMWEDIEKMYSGQVYEVRGQHYDLVLNGTEIGGGSVRVHDANMQEYIFSEILQLSNSERSSFDHLLHALRCGAPPHGGIALGFDRLMAILCKAESIRDVIAFPKTGAGTDLLFRSPAPASSPDILQQYGIEQQRS